MAMSENSKKVLNYMKEINGADVTAADVAAALGLEKRQIDGIFTSAIQRKGYGFRQEEAVVGGKIKYLKLTDEGKSFDVNAPVDAE